MRVAILGYGNVAQALLPILQTDRRFEVAGVHSRSRPAAPSAEAFLLQSRADVLVELTSLNPETGQPAIHHVQTAFALGMHVVTANKGPIAHAYDELSAEALKHSVQFRWESTVMDGAPVFNQFRNNMPGVMVLGFAGVLNSTSNVVIQTMEEGGSFADGVARARSLGITEADPSFDIDGWDSAVKTAALANVLFGAHITPQQVNREGMAYLTPPEIRRLAGQGKTVRLVSRGQRNGSQQVRPELLLRTELLASMRGTSNLLLFHTDHMGTWGTVSIEPGVQQTAYGVYIDLVDLLS